MSVAPVLGPPGSATGESHLGHPRGQAWPRAGQRRRTRWPGAAAFGAFPSRPAPGRPPVSGPRGHRVPDTGHPVATVVQAWPRGGHGGHAGGQGHAPGGVRSPGRGRRVLRGKTRERPHPGAGAPSASRCGHATGTGAPAARTHRHRTATAHARPPRRPRREAGAHPSHQGAHPSAVENGKRVRPPGEPPSRAPTGPGGPAPDRGRARPGGAVLAMEPETDHGPHPRTPGPAEHPLATPVHPRGQRPRRALAKVAADARPGGSGSELPRPGGRRGHLPGHRCPGLATAVASVATTARHRCPGRWTHWAHERRRRCGVRVPARTRAAR